MNKTIEAPIRFPTKISGSFSKMAFTPTESSLIEVKSPRIKKETIKEDIFKVLDNLPTALTAIPDPIQIPANEKRYISR
jgi:hypothetical protein